jgi:hypothetical protein
MGVLVWARAGPTNATPHATAKPHQARRSALRMRNSIKKTKKSEIRTAKSATLPKKTEGLRILWRQISDFPLRGRYG